MPCESWARWVGEGKRQRMRCDKCFIRYHIVVKTTADSQNSLAGFIDTQSVQWDATVMEIARAIFDKQLEGVNHASDASKALFNLCVTQLFEGICGLGLVWAAGVREGRGVRCGGGSIRRHRIARTACRALSLRSAPTTCLPPRRPRFAGSDRRPNLRPRLGVAGAADADSGHHADVRGLGRAGVGWL